MLAIGAILAFAVDAGVEGVDLSVVGIVLMIVGGVAVILSAARGGFGGTRMRTERVTSADGREVIEDREISH
jgi:hypothetical protein